ncbi:LamG-like jellyroll fold domain-containing protein [Fontivita pretiosa]|uniref:LamG-like jellyroll fold domain-containing protein n=1 Tax=Fontivita pretiosa TaxID=2989684 RepID=UPI003D175B7A
MRLLHATLFVALALLAGAAPIEGATVALWLFDDPVDSVRGAVLKDSSGNGYDLELGQGRIVPEGKFGNGLACPSSVTEFVARRSGVQGTALNLGNRDWTIEWWQRRDAPVARGHVDWVYLLADDELDRDAAAKSWELGFQTESRFCGPGVWCHDQASVWGDRPLFLNVFADKYDEVNRIAIVRDVNMDFYRGADRDFHHIAWVYDARIKRLMYFEDGRGPFYVRDGTFDTPGNQAHSVYGIMGMGPLEKYPWKYDVYNASAKVSLYIGGRGVIGPDQRSGMGIAKIPEGYRFSPRPLAEQTASSVIDEMRVSDQALYHAPFTPRASLAEQRPREKSSPWLTLSRRRLQYRSVAGKTPPPSQTIRLENSGGGQVAWKAQSQATWLTITPAEGHLSDTPIEVVVSVDPSKLHASIHRCEIVFTSDSPQPPQIVAVECAIQPVDSVVWLFDEPAGSPSRFQLEDQTINGYDLLLGPGGAIVPGGRFGNALDPRGPRPGQAATRRYIDPGHLNLGDFDWTWECWVRPDEPAAEGDVLFMARENIRIGPWPYYSGVGPATGLEFGRGATLRFINERSGLSGRILQTDPKLTHGDGQWHHVAVAYESASRRLSHWVDGVRCDSVALAAPLVAFEPTGENNLSIGKTIDGQRPFKGLIDEMRFTAGLRYGDAGRFDPPASLAPPRQPIALRAGPHLLIDDQLIAESQNLQRVQHSPEYPVDKPKGWDEYMQVVGASDIVDDGPDCPDPRRRFKRVSYFHSLAESTGIGGYMLYCAPTRSGPWVSYEGNPFLPYVWAGQPGSMVGGSDVLAIQFDSVLRKYLIFHKTYPLSGENPELAWYRDERFNYHNRVLSGHRRLPSLMTSDDAIHWSTPQRIINLDDWDIGEAQAQVHMVWRRGDLLLGHLCIHHDEIDRGAMYTVLTCSRDGYHWTRFREPFIPYGQEPTRGDKVIFPYGNDQLFIRGQFMYLGISVQGSHKPPRRAWSGCARLPIDRFVSRGARGDRPGRFTTPLLVLDKSVDGMLLNVRTHDSGNEAGYIRVQARDQHGRVIRGFSFRECLPISGDSLKHPVRWNRRSLSELAAGDQPLRLEFELRDAELYAFYLTGPQWRGDADFVAESDPGRSDLTDPYELLGIARPDPRHPAAITVTPQSLTFELKKLPGLGYSGQTPPQTFTVKPADPAHRCTIRHAIPWLMVEPQGQSNADGSVSYTARASGGALEPAVYLGKISLRTDPPGQTLDIPVTFRLE